MKPFLSNYDRFMPLSKDDLFMPVWIVFISGKILEDLESVYGTQKTLDFLHDILRKLEEFYPQ